MQTSLLLGVGVVGASLTGCTSEDGEKSKHSLPKGIFYSSDNQGRWKGKEGSHSPIITVNGNTITVETKHGMSEVHYIVKHTLLTEGGEVLGETVFSPKDEKAISTFNLKQIPKYFVATSFCNLHDLWISEYKS